MDSTEWMSLGIFNKIVPTHFDIIIFAIFHVAILLGSFKKLKLYIREIIMHPRLPGRYIAIDS